MLRTTSILKDKTQTTQSQVRFSTSPAYQDFPNQPTLPANQIPPKQPTQPTYQDFPGFVSELSIFNNVHQDPVSVAKQ